MERLKDKIVLITGAVSDTTTGGSGGNEFIDATAGRQQVTGGTGGNETIWGGAGDIIMAAAPPTRRSAASPTTPSPVAAAPNSSMEPAVIS